MRQPSHLKSLAAHDKYNHVPITLQPRYPDMSVSASLNFREMTLSVFLSCLRIACSDPFLAARHISFSSSALWGELGVLLGAYTIDRGGGSKRVWREAADVLGRWREGKGRVYYKVSESGYNKLEKAHRMCSRNALEVVCCGVCGVSPLQASEAVEVGVPGGWIVQQVHGCQPADNAM